MVKLHIRDVAVGVDLDVRRGAGDVEDAPVDFAGAVEAVVAVGAEGVVLVLVGEGPRNGREEVGAGGYRDTLGNPFPPFAFGSGLAWADISRDEAIKLGLVPGDAKAGTPSLSPSEADMADAARRLGFDDAFTDLAG